MENLSEESGTMTKKIVNSTENMSEAGVLI
jgi:hypothetical protein